MRTFRRPDGVSGFGPMDFIGYVFWTFIGLVFCMFLGLFFHVSRNVRKAERQQLARRPTKAGDRRMARERAFRELMTDKEARPVPAYFLVLLGACVVLGLGMLGWVLTQ